MNQILNKLFNFATLVIYILAAIGCPACCLAYHQPLFAGAGVVLAVMAFPVVKRAYKQMTDDDNFD